MSLRDAPITKHCKTRHLIPFQHTYFQLTRRTTSTSHLYIAIERHVPNSVQGRLPGLQQLRGHTRHTHRGGEYIKGSTTNRKQKRRPTYGQPFSMNRSPTFFADCAKSFPFLSGLLDLGQTRASLLTNKHSRQNAKLAWPLPRFIPRFYKKKVQDCRQETHTRHTTIEHTYSLRPVGYIAGAGRRT